MSLMTPDPKTSSSKTPIDSIIRSPLYLLIRRIVVGMVGTAVVIAGIILLPLPGPGMLVILLGGGILATEFRFAKQWLACFRRRIRRWGIRFPGRRRKK